MKRIGPIAVALALTLLTSLAATAPTAGAVKFVRQQIGTFSNPVFVAGPRKSKRFFVVERAGRINVYDHGKRKKRPFLDISDQVLDSYQRGMLSMAFAPGYSRNGRFYVFFVDNTDNVRVDEFHRRKGHPNQAALASQRNVINIGRGSFYHHGGQVQFGPDGMLYISTGVADMDSWAQHLDNLHGKMLRIDPRRKGSQPYRVPIDNPFVATPGVRPEIWAYGLRNPWRFDFNDRNGGLAIADVGNIDAEEVDYLARGRSGANFGFPIFEGNQRLRSGPVPERYKPPIIEHLHRGPGAFCAVIGGFFVRDKKLKGLYGRYLYADLCSSVVRSARIGKSGRVLSNRTVDLSVLGPNSWGEDSRGRLYEMGSDGPVYRIVRAPAKAGR